MLKKWFSQQLCGLQIEMQPKSQPVSLSSMWSIKKFEHIDGLLWSSDSFVILEIRN